MAKFGESDPRWLVKDMGSGGTNVNNWHWVEKDAMEWSNTKLQSLFKDLVVLDGSKATFLKITGLDSCTGEAIINNRKNKVIPSYELEIKLNWEGEVRDGSGNAVATAKGKVHLPYVADENHDEDPEVKLINEAADNASQKLREAFFADGRKVILEKINAFVKELRAGGPALASDSSSDAGAASTTENGQSKQKLSSAKPEEVKPAADSTSKPSSSRSSAGRSLSLTEKYYCRPSDIFECFTVEARIKAFTQSQASVELQPGGKFSWFGGSVQGVFTELTPGKQLKMDWRFSTWEDNCYSKVVIDLEEPEPGTTIVKLKQTDIPGADRFGNEDVFENTEKGWRAQILTRIRQIFGYGVGM